MQFYITVEVQRRLYRFRVEQIKLTDQIEQYKLYGKHQNMILQSNRPLLEGKKLKHKKILWQIKQGHYSNQYAFEKCKGALEAFVKEYYAPPKEKYVHPKNY